MVELHDLISEDELIDLVRGALSRRGIRVNRSDAGSVYDALAQALSRPSRAAVQPIRTGTLHVVDADDVLIGPAEQHGSNVRLLSWRLPFVARPDPSNGSATEQLAAATITALREEVEDLQDQLGRLELQRDRIAANYGVLQDAVRAVQVLDIDADPVSRPEPALVALRSAGWPGSEDG